MTGAKEPSWLTVADVISVHSEQLAMFGGPAGVRDAGLLESTVNRPINRWNYEGSDLATLAAAYAFGISRNHPFIDGNKRAAFAAMMIFLRINGIRLAAPSAEATAVMLSLAAGELDEDLLAKWIKDNWPKEP